MKSGNGNNENDGVTLWFTGLPCSGKTTVSQLVYERLRRCGSKAGSLGIEVYWSKHDSPETSQYKELAARYGLIVTGGSHFHGENKPTIELGTGLNGHLDEDFVLHAPQPDSIQVRVVVPQPM